jgi:hypothetical protein
MLLEKHRELFDKLNDLLMYGKLDKRINKQFLKIFSRNVGVRYLDKEPDESKRYQIYLRNLKSAISGKYQPP